MIGEVASAEIWRHCEQRGYYTRLQSPVSEILREKGYEPTSDEIFTPDNPLPECHSLNVPPPLSEGILYDCIELFRGEGNWSLAHSSNGLRVHNGVDITGIMTE